MSFFNASMMNREVVILYYEDTGEIDDETGNAVVDEFGITTVGEIQPRRTDEPSGHPDIASSDWIGFFLSDDGPYLDSGSIVWIPGEGEYEVVGEPFLRRDPFNETESYIKAGLSRVAGTADTTGS
jgi:hypothetical protein